MKKRQREKERERERQTMEKRIMSTADRDLFATGILRGGEMRDKKYANFIRPFSSQYSSRRTIRRLARNSALLYSRRPFGLNGPKKPGLLVTFENCKRRRGKERRTWLNLSRGQSDLPRKKVRHEISMNAGKSRKRKDVCSQIHRRVYGRSKVRPCTSTRSRH